MAVPDELPVFKELAAEPFVDDGGLVDGDLLLTPLLLLLPVRLPTLPLLLLPISPLALGLPFDMTPPLA